MRISLLLSILLFVSPVIIIAQPSVSLSSYSAININDSIAKKVSAIYRVDEGYLEILSPSKYNFKVHQVVTLLNKDAAKHFSHTLHYDKFQKVEDVEIKIYDALGVLVKKYGKKDFETSGYQDRVSLYTDDKVMHLQSVGAGYPCTVETSYEYRTSGYIELPDWYIGSPEEAVESCKYTVKVPEALDIKYRTTGIELTPEIKSEAGIKTYTWSAKNFSGVKIEANGYEASSIYPKIQVTPQTFEYDGYKGELNSWQSYGAWNYQFYQDNKPFNKAQSAEILTAVANCRNDREKVKVLYDRLKKTMRYVSIQLGIGGFKPFPVQYVYEKQYGDCKALTNYMRYMLKTAGIESYPALVNAGSDQTAADPNFPAHVFNHVILCVPINKDTIWLECTSKNNEYGVLGSFTENKNALVLTEKGGILIATPRSDYTRNVLSTKTIIQLNEDGSSKAQADIFCKGDFWDVFYEINKQTSDDQKDLFVNYLKYKLPQGFRFESMGEKDNGNRLHLDLSYDKHYDFKAGSKLFLTQKISRLCNEELNASERKQNYLFSFPYQKRDTTIYNLPAGTTVDNLPASKEISNDYVYYKNEFLKNADSTVLTVVSELSIKKHVISSADYSNVASVIYSINQNEKEKIVLKKE